MDTIDRRSVVERHDVSVDGVLPDSPLSVGNGELGVTVDVTGLQTFPDAYPLEERGGGVPGSLLATLSQWAWHEFPGGDQHDLRSTWRWYDSPRGEVPYVDMRGTVGATSESGANATERWLRANPHRLDLARLGFVLDGASSDPRPPELSQLEAVDQRLELWTGTIHSRCRLAGHDVEVVTACHPDRDALGVRIRSSGLVDGALALRLAFPYGSGSWNVAADWSRPDDHTTRLRSVASGWVIDRTLDGTRIVVRLRAGPDASVRELAPHELVLSSMRDVLELVLEFSEPAQAATDRVDDLPDAPSLFADAARHWAAWWSDSGALDLDGSTDERAPELERRVVLSRYLAAINCAGSLPPQETGLLCNSWHGKFHLEMYWWHAAHFVTWDQPAALERSLAFFERTLDRARGTATDQGLPGARWPKQVGPDGRESPSPIATFLLWQQPHPIHLAELLRRVRGAEVVARYGEVVLETATFMAALPVRTERGYELPPPLVPAQESYAYLRERASNPTFELAYWAWALRIAQRWRLAMGLAPEPSWDEVADGLVRPHVRDGVYTAIDVEPYTIREDHPSMVYALGVVPPTSLIDPETMRRTLFGVLVDWDWTSTWGWDYPALAMTAARLGEPRTAVDALLLDVPKNRYLRNGHNRQTATLPAYLPGNGGLLSAVALMAAGWEGADGHAPGFPEGWRVRFERLHPSP